MFSTCFDLRQTRNLLRIAIFNISYIRGLFPEKYFSDKNVPALGELAVFRYPSYSSSIQILLYFPQPQKLCLTRNEDQEAHANGCGVTETD